MISNYYTLAHLAEEWRSRSHDVALAQPFTQTRHELVLPFEPVSPGSAEGRWVAIVDCTPAQNILVLKERYARARRNSVDIFPGVEGSLVSDMEMHPSDRQMRLSLRTGNSIVLQFFGPKANVLLVGPDGRVVDTFLRSKHMSAGDQFEWPTEARISWDEDRLRAALVVDRSGTLLQSLKRTLPSFGPVLLRETLARASAEGREAMADLDERTLVRVVRAALDVHAAMTAPARPRIYYREEVPAVFSPAPLIHMADLRADEPASVSDGIRTFISTAHRRADFSKSVERLFEALTHAADQAATTLRRIEEEWPDVSEADRSERHAKLLHANLSDLRKGMREAIVEDLFSDGREIVAIALDPHLTPAKNAERLFERARKIRTTLAEQQERRTSLQERVKVLTGIIEEMDGLATDDDLTSLLDRHQTYLRSAGIRTTGGSAPPPTERPPFRIFTVDGGYQVWAGKSGENNDLLSTRHTAKNDLWFHVRGISGSHVVLKQGTGRGEISKRAKEQAAAIAAFYSKMKKARHVAVIMCDGKYVRKPRGASPGTVTVERETVLFVDPALPEGAPEE